MNVPNSVESIKVPLVVVNAHASRTTGKSTLDHIEVQHTMMLVSGCRCGGAGCERMLVLWWSLVV